MSFFGLTLVVLIVLGGLLLVTAVGVADDPLVDR